MTQKEHSNTGKWRSRLGRLYHSRIRSAFVLVLVSCIVVSTGYSKSESSQYKEYEIKAAFIYNFLKFIDWPREKSVHRPGEITIGIVGNDPFAKSFSILENKKVKDCRVVIQCFGTLDELKKTVEKDKAKLYQQIKSLGKSCVLLKDENGKVVIKPLESIEELKNAKDETTRQKLIEELKKKGLRFVDPAKKEHLKIIINSLAQEKIEALKKCHVLFLCSSEKQNLREILTLVKTSSVLTVAETEGFLKAGAMINFTMEDNKIRFEVNLTAANEAKLQVRSQLLRVARKVIKEDSFSNDNPRQDTHKEK